MALRRFRAVQDFYSDELKSHYVAGLGYTARAEDGVLLGLLERWLEEGKVVEVEGTATLVATGIVS